MHKRTGFEEDDDEITQVVNDMLGILERSNINYYEAIASVRLLERVLWTELEFLE